MIASNATIGIVGAGTMGSGIALVAAQNGHSVIVFDSRNQGLLNAQSFWKQNLEKLVEKNKLTKDQSESILLRLKTVDSIDQLSGCSLVIEAAVEAADVKAKIFEELEKACAVGAILATNTSSLSVTSIAASCKNPERIAGLHFFNPATIMPLVEVIPALQSKDGIVNDLVSLMKSWSKVPVIAKDTPGFIVNRIARPFYGEAIRIYEEGLADFATIDHAMKTIGRFKMGPFELMDLIGNDVNFSVTKTVWEQMFFDGRYTPSITQKRLFEAGHFGRKSGRGYYNYQGSAALPTPSEDSELHQRIFMRIISMLINEAVHALHCNVASVEDIELAMLRGVNYPAGLLEWCNRLGADKVYAEVKSLHDVYLEERYRPSPLLRKHAIEKKLFNV